MRALLLAAVIGSLGIINAAAQNRPAQESLDAASARKYKAELQNIQELANRGNPNALFHLGLMHYEGWGVPQNYAEAVRLFELAAEKSHTQALIWLGDSYSDGNGVPKDYVEAHKYYDLAASQSKHGDLELSGIYRDIATKKRNDLALKMTSAQIAEAQKRAREWKPKGSLSRDPM